MNPDRINELLTTQTTIVREMAENPEKGYEHLQGVWPTLDEDDKELIITAVIQNLEFLIKGSNEINHKRDIFCRAAVKYMLDDSRGDSSSYSLTSGAGIKDIQWAKLFYELKRIGALVDSNNTIALAVSKLLNLKHETIKHYFNNTSLFNGVKDIIPLAGE